MTDGGFKDSVRRTASDKVLRDKAFSIAENPKYDGYQTSLPCMIYKFFDKNTFNTESRKIFWLIRTLDNKIYKVMTAVSKNVYNNKLDDIVNEYNNTYCKTIKMKPTEVKNNTYFDYIEVVNDKDSKFKVGVHVIISRYKYIFAIGYTPNWSEDVFVIEIVKNTAPWTYLINDLNGQEIIETFYVEELQKPN